MSQDMFTQLIQAETRNRELLRLLESIKPIDLRDQFAMAAMQGLMPIYWETQDEYMDAAALVKCQCESAYDYADAMLKAREES